MAMPMNEFFYGGNEQPRWQEIDDYRRPYNFDSRTSKGALPTYEFRVPMCCSKCEEKVREELSELEGACEVFADQLSERVAVTGFVDPFRALKKMKRIKKKSEFWGESSPTLKSSHHKKSSHSSHKKHHHPRHETVYRSSSSQVSYNREPSRTSSSLGHSLSHKKNHASYDDGVSYRNKYGSYDDGVSFRNKRHASYDDGVSYRNKYGSYDDGVSFRNKRGFYDDGVSFRNKYGSFDDSVSFRNKYGSFDDGVSYSDLRSSSSRGLSYRPNHASYDDMSYRNHYGSYDDGRVSYSDLTCGPSSSLFSCLPRSRSLRYDTVPPFAQDYYTEDYVEDYPLYNRY